MILGRYFFIAWTANWTDPVSLPLNPLLLIFKIKSSNPKRSFNKGTNWSLKKSTGWSQQSFVIPVNSIENLSLLYKPNNIAGSRK